MDGHGCGPKHLHVANNLFPTLAITKSAIIGCWTSSAEVAHAACGRRVDRGARHGRTCGATGSSRRNRRRSRTRKCAEAADADAHRNVGLSKCADLLKAWRVVTGVCFTACNSCFLFYGSCGLRIFDVVLDSWHLFMLMCHCTRGSLIRSLNPSLLHSLRHSLGIAPSPAALLQI